MPTKTFVTELVNAFNLNNYFSDNIYTNFAVQGGTKGKNDKIVSLFGCDGNIKKYLKEIREEIIRQHYSNEEAAGGFYKLNCFPFVFDVDFNKKGKFINQNVKVVELANLTDSEVIHNLKLHFANEFQDHVEAGVTGELKTMGMTKDEALKCVRKSVQLERVDELSPYLYCISFDDGYFKEMRHPNPLRFLELFRNIYVAKFNLRLERCGLNDSSIFYEQRDNKLYIKDITDINVIKNIARYVKKRIALDFKTPGKEDSKVENFKNILSELIFEVTGNSVDGYEYDVFTDEEKINDGHSFALIPLVRRIDDQLRTLSREEADKIVEKFYSVLSDIVLSDITGKTESTQFTTGKSIYAFSNKQIALLLPKIMESPIAYNERNGRFEFAVDLRSQQFVFPTPPPTPVPNRRLNSDEKPGPSSELSQSQAALPRQAGLLFNPVNLGVAGPSARMSSIVVNPGISGPSSQSLSAAHNVSAAWSHDPWSPQSTSGNKWPLPTQSGDSSYPQQSFNGPIRFSSRGPRLPLYARPPSVHSEDSGLGTNLWTQQPNRWSLQSTSGNQWMQSHKSTPAAQRWSFSSPPPPPFIPSSSNVSGSQPPTPSGTSSWKGAQAGANISEEEKS